METVEALEGVGVLILAIALLAAFTLRMAVPPPDVLRAASAPQVVMVHPTIVIDTSR